MLHDLHSTSITTLDIISTARLLFDECHVTKGYWLSDSWECNCYTHGWPVHLPSTAHDCKINVGFLNIFSCYGFKPYTYPVKIYRAEILMLKISPLHRIFLKICRKMFFNKVFWNYSTVNDSKKHTRICC